MTRSNWEASRTLHSPVALPHQVDIRLRGHHPDGGPVRVEHVSHEVALFEKPPRQILGFRQDEYAVAGAADE